MSIKPTNKKPEQPINDVEKKFAGNKTAGESLRESMEKYRQLFENESDAVMIFDWETGRFEDANKATLALYGYSKDEFLTLTVEDISAEKEKTRLAVQKIKDGGLDNLRVPLRYFQKKNGTIFPGEIAASVFTSGGRKKIIGAVRDISDRIHIEEKLRESEEKYRSLVDNIAIGVAMISPDMEILTLNNQMKQWFPMIDTSTRPICYQSYNNPPRKGVCPYCPTIKTLQDGEVHEAVTDTPIGDQIMHYRILSSPIKDHTGRVIAAIEMVENITAHKRAEAQIQNLSHQILKAQEEERQMISRELHDRVAQDLSTLKIAVEMLFDDQSKLPRNTAEKLSELSKRLDRSISSVRNLSYDLSPPGLKEFGLIQTLAAYCEEFAKNTGIEVDFRSAGLKTSKTDSLIEINLYRLIQEGLNNVRKHADAGRVFVRLVGAYPDIILRVEDNGKGFDVQAQAHSLESEKRMGLRSMKERVNLLQGRMTIQSCPGKGTKILIKFPFQEDKNGS